MNRLLVIVLVSACASPGTPCAPGELQECACPGSTARGMQACATNGRSFSACTGCPGDDAAVNPAPETCGPGSYPCGPYGYEVGSTIANLELLGKRDDNANGHIDTGDALVDLKLSDIGAGAHAIVIDICAEWCGPCRQDQPNLDTLAQSYGASVAFYDVMIEDRNTQPGDAGAVNRWGTLLHVPYPIAADPAAITTRYFAAVAFPMHLLVRTSDMTIVDAHTGVDPDLQTKVDGVLAAP